jgi:site-specific recombinase XerD
VNERTGNAISRVQAYRIIRGAGCAVGLVERVSCHSLRKTFGYHAWKSGVSPVVIMDIYNHSSFDVTRRYLGVCKDDRDAVYMKFRLDA